jgi:hypothetical protein
MKLNKIRALCALPISVLGPFGFLLTLLLTKLWEIRFDIRLLVASISLFILFILSYSIVLNEGVLRGAYLVLLNYFLYSIITSRSWIKSASYVSNVIYAVNILFLIIGSVFDSVEIFFNPAGVGANRVGGLIGYDFVAFFVSIYIISKIEISNLNFGWQLFFHLSLATFVTLNSGRFGFLILLILYLYVFVRFATIKMIMAFGICGIVSYALNSDRVNLILATVLGVYQYIVEDSIDMLNLVSSSKPSGFYGASPLTWSNEVGLAFGNLYDHLLPSQLYMAVDSGPAYLILNTGLILTLFYYFLLHYFLRQSNISKISHMAVFSIILLTDLKFRSALTVFIMFWIYINFAQSQRRWN